MSGLGGVWRRLYNGETRYDFVGKRNVGFVVSGVLLLVTLVSLVFQGLNLGLDFKGGVAWDSPATGQLTSERALEIVAANGIDDGDAKVQTLNSADGTRLRIQVGDQTREVQEKVRGEIAEAAGVDVEEVALNSVSATWGEEITRKAVQALVVFFLLLFLYITWRFEWKMAISAIVATVHDVVVSVGVYSVLRFSVTPATVIAFLTILGFSLYDTIVVFDKVDENAKRMGGGRYTYGDVVNLSMNQVLMRSLNTSLAAVLPVLSLLVVGSLLLGAVALQDFALALLVGMIAGSYSSIFIAAPLLAMLKERFEPKYRQLKAKLGEATGESVAQRMDAAESPSAQVAARPAAAAAAAAAVSATGGAATEVAPTAAPRGADVGSTAALTHPPRPRKKRRR